jgi:hypothetical protein
MHETANQKLMRELDIERQTCSYEFKLLVKHEEARRLKVSYILLRDEKLHLIAHPSPQMTMNGRGSTIPNSKVGSRPLESRTDKLHSPLAVFRQLTMRAYIGSHQTNYTIMHHAVLPLTLLDAVSHRTCIVLWR